MTINPDKTMLAIWMAGFLDGRGGFFIHESRGKYKEFVIKIASKNSITLNLLDRILVYFNIKHCRHKQFIAISNREDIKQLVGIILPFIQIKEYEIIEFREKLFEYELSFVNSPQVLQNSQKRLLRTGFE